MLIQVGGTTRLVLELQQLLLDNLLLVTFAIVIFGIAVYLVGRSRRPEASKEWYDHNGFLICGICTRAEGNRNKRAYQSQSEAIGSAQYFAAKFGNTPQRAYFENRCGNWHLTSQPRRSPARNRVRR